MNRIARFFVNTFNARRNARIEHWVRERASVPGGAVCLEIGCGNADLASRLVSALKPSRYVATDLDPKQIETARRHLEKRYPGGVPATLELRPADMLHLPFDAASFDAAFAVVSIHHASPNHHDPANVPLALADIDRVLRPGGVLAYEEIIHKELIRSWLEGHGYAVRVVQRGIKRESVVARKAAPA